MSNVRTHPTMFKDSTTEPPKPQIVKYREKRVDVSGFSATTATIKLAESPPLTAKVLNISRFGVRLSLSDTVTLPMVRRGQAVDEVMIMFAKVCVYSGNAIIVDESQAPLRGGPALGLALFGDGVDVDQIQAIMQLETAGSEVELTRSTLDMCAGIHMDFKALVADLHTFMQDLRLKLQVEERRISEMAASDGHRRRLEEHTVNLAINLYGLDIQHIFDRFLAITSRFDFDTALLHKRYFHTNFHPQLLTSPFTNRAFTKPLGYAGDYGLMVMLYEYEDTGKNLFDKFVHRLACEAPSAVANKNRVIFLSELLSMHYYDYLKHHKGPYKVSSIACGPAREVQLFLESLETVGEGGIAVVCTDQEDAALEHAQRKIRQIQHPGKRVQASFIQDDVVLGLIRGRDIAKEIAGSNIITCAGLYDYLSDRVASRLISAMFELLIPGGTLLIGNVSDRSPDRFSMDYIMEWNLLLRSSADLLRLVPDAISKTAGVKIDVVSEPLGLNLFLRIVKAGDA